MTSKPRPMERMAAFAVPRGMALRTAVVKHPASSAPLEPPSPAARSLIWAALALQEP
jgi:hypothetical protein